ncbi:MAG: hypothetical protein AB1657_01630 [Candidatus Micrarchaeota archaeon]
MVLKEKETREETLGVPVPVERRAEAMVPVAARAVDYSAYSIEKLRESVTSMELDHHNFPTPYEASAYTHMAERWERLPINKNHGSARHDPAGKLFENLRSACSEI